MVYRSFGYVQSRLLLEQQDIVRKLEFELEMMDHCDTENSPNLLRSRDDFGDKRVSLLKTLKREWLDYYKSLITATMILPVKFGIAVEP